jgi:type IV pilus assembly protein PilA
MFARIMKARGEREGGFTLIELLVVIIIIGILAAIAIPVFLNQREKGWDAQAKSDVKNMATAEETVLTDTGAYTAVVADLTGAGFKASGDTSAHAATATGSSSYCVQATSQSGTIYSLSSTGNVTTGAC